MNFNFFLKGIFVQEGSSGTRFDHDQFEIKNDTIFRNVQVWQNYEYNRTVLFQKGDRGVAPETFFENLCMFKLF